VPANAGRAAATVKHARPIKPIELRNVKIPCMGLGGAWPRAVGRRVVSEREVVWVLMARFAREKNDRNDLAGSNDQRYTAFDEHCVPSL
jgi:hypothetical protein